MNGTNFEMIQSGLDGFCAAWKANDGEALGGCFTEDGSLVNPFGQRADGRDAVAAMYSKYFEGMLRGTSTTYDVTQVRVIGGEHAFVDGRQLVRSDDGKVLLDVHLAALLRREGKQWRFADARPYVYVAAPGQ